MLRPRFSKQHATFPPGYSVPRWMVALSRLANRSRPVRIFVVERLPRGRLRLVLLANYYHWVVERIWADEAHQVMGAFAPDGVWEGFDGLETYRGREGYVQMWSDLLDTFGANGNLAEFIDPDPAGSRFIAVVRTRMRGPGSGIELEQFGGEFSASVTVTRGDAVGFQLFQTKAEALEAVRFPR